VASVREPQKPRGMEDIDSIEYNKNWANNSPQRNYTCDPFSQPGYEPTFSPE